MLLPNVGIPEAKPHTGDISSDRARFGDVSLEAVHDGLDVFRETRLVLDGPPLNIREEQHRFLYGIFPPSLGAVSAYPHVPPSEVLQQSQHVFLVDSCIPALPREVSDGSASIEAPQGVVDGRLWLPNPVGDLLKAVEARLTSHQEGKDEAKQEAAIRRISGPPTPLGVFFGHQAGRGV